jgi:16S rRNA (uracil1498-N3)-methyltransferase
MARYDFRCPRLYVDEPLRMGTSVGLEAAQTHYLTTVLRLKPHDSVLVFNGRDGEWRALLNGSSKRSATLVVEQLTRPQTAATDLHYLFAPLKRARLDYVVQKAVELGVSCLQPVSTRHTQADRVNVARMRANAIEAAEQCGILNLPEVQEPVGLAAALDRLQASRLLVFCDEDAPITDPAAALAGAKSGMKSGMKSGIKSEAESGPDAPALAVLIGPEGGFSDDERALILQRAATVRLALGPRILRADTAAVAALALVQTVLGDWR